MCVELRPFGPKGWLEFDFKANFGLVIFGCELLVCSDTYLMLWVIVSCYFAGITIYGSHSIRGAFNRGP
jgi:hypothetical protein